MPNLLYAISGYPALIFSVSLPYGLFLYLQLNFTYIEVILMRS